MVVLSIAVLSKIGGKVLVSRQFVDTTYSRIESLLTAFPKFVTSGDRCHSTVSTETVRYVYRVLESLYVVLVTNKTSNIVEDLKTLELVCGLVAEVCVGSPSVPLVTKASFKLIHAFDEIVAWGGHKIDIPLRQVMTNLTMWSHEEQLHLLIQASKINEAKEEAKRKEKMIRESRRALPVQGTGPTSHALTSMLGFGSGGTDESGSPRQDQRPMEPEVRRLPTLPVGKRGKGMQLMSSKHKQTEVATVLAEDGLRGDGAPTASSIEALSAATSRAAPVGLATEEKITVKLNREGGMELMEVKGMLQLTVADARCTRAKIQCHLGAFSSELTIQNHPNVDKSVFQQNNIICLRHADREWPLGKQLGVLRWRWVNHEPAMLPLSINCWPEDIGGGKTNVNIEYTLERSDMVLQDVCIRFPLGGSNAAPAIVSADGLYKHFASEGMMEWRLGLIDASSSSGSLEFNISGVREAGGFFPVTVSFLSMSTFCDIRVAAVDGGDGEAVPHTHTGVVTVDSYVVE